MRGADAGSADEGPWAPATYSPAHALASDGVWAASCSVAMVAPGAGAGNALLSTGEHLSRWYYLHNVIILSNYYYVKITAESRVLSIIISTT